MRFRIKKRWVVVYLTPTGPKPSEPMYKWAALDYLCIFKDALWIQKQSGLFRRKIYRKGQKP